MALRRRLGEGRVGTVVPAAHGLRLDAAPFTFPHRDEITKLF
jgi:hypothetical protein